MYVSGLCYLPNSHFVFIKLVFLKYILFKTCYSNKILQQNYGVKCFFFSHIFGNSDSPGSILNVYKDTCKMKYITYDRIIWQKKVMWCVWLKKKTNKKKIKKLTICLYVFPFQAMYFLILRIRINALHIYSLAYTWGSRFKIEYFS